MFMKQCIYCDSSKLYIKSQTQYQCITCKRRWSEQKYQKECSLIDSFIKNETILEATQKRGIHYSVGKKAYFKMRLLLTNYAQEQYANQSEPFTQYDEFYYLPQTKKKDSKYVLDAVGIFGMLYDDWVYTLLLPDQFAAFKRLVEHEEEIEHEAFARYLTSHKVAHIKSFEHRLGEFWKFFEIFMSHFKGVKKENLVYYLKEAEFKFNHSQEEQYTILMHLWKQNM